MKPNPFFVQEMQAMMIGVGGGCLKGHNCGDISVLVDMAMATETETAGKAEKIVEAEAMFEWGSPREG
jgi:hypothetical protein